VLSLASELPPEAQEFVASAISASSVIAISNFAILCTLNNSFRMSAGNSNSRGCLTTLKLVCYKS